MASRINRELYDKNHISHIFDYPKEESHPKMSRNIQPIKIELKGEKVPTQKNNVLKTFINKNKIKPKSYKVDIIKNKYHNDSDIFFTRTLSPSKKQELKEEAFPEKEEFISDYKPEKYLKFNNSSFDQKMHDLYNEKGDKFMKNKSVEKGKPKKVKVSSKGYSEYVDKYNNENYSNIKEFIRNHNINHKETEKQFYNKQNKYNPNLTASDNYNRGFESDVFNVKNKNYAKFIDKNKRNNRLNKSVDNGKRNVRVKGLCKWPADFNWTKNSELIFKTHVKNLQRNKSMTAYERNNIDSVQDLIEGENKNKKIKRNRSDLGRSDYKRPSFDKKMYTLSRAKKLENNCSVLDDEKSYRNNIKVRGMGKKFAAKEYLVAKPGNMDIYEFEKLMKKKGIHLIEVNEKNSVIQNDKENNNDRIIHFKIRENIVDDKKNEKLKDVERELKKKNRQLQIRAAPKKKNHGLKSCDFHYRNSNGKKKREEILKS